MTRKIIAQLQYAGAEGSSVFTDDTGRAWSPMFGGTQTPPVAATITQTKPAYAGAGAANFPLTDAFSTTCLETAVSTDFAIGLEDFTLRTFFRFSSLTYATAGIYGGGAIAGGGYKPTLSVTYFANPTTYNYRAPPSGVSGIVVNLSPLQGASNAAYTIAFSPVVDTLYCIQVNRVAGVISVSINGTPVAMNSGINSAPRTGTSLPDTSDIAAPSSPVWIGSTSGNAYWPFIGYISATQLTRGYAWPHYVPTQAYQMSAANASASVAKGSSNNALSPVISALGSQPDPVTPESMAVVTPPANGTAVVSGASILYTPAAGYVGTDNFTYQANVGGLLTNVATASINVVNPPPSPTCDELGRTTTINVSGYNRSSVHDVRVVRGEKRCLVANFNGALPAGRTIASVTWRCVQPYVAIMSNPRIIVGQRQVAVDVKANYYSDTIIKCEATLDNGEVMAQLVRVSVMDSPWFEAESVAADGPYVLTAP